MQRAVTVEEFLKRKEDPSCRVIDVRSPSEFAQGHIPSAINIPLFDDAERKEVGTLYKQVGREAAFMRGLELVGPKLANYVRQAETASAGRELLVHCWRGGMRSGSLSTLWTQAGFRVSSLVGGYKAFRKYIREALGMPRQIMILGGMTGSGKTEILQLLAARGEQILDLEGLAHHKGSIFGAIGEPPQPSNEQFENNLFEAWKHTSPSRILWVEDESQRIGRVFVPDPLWAQMVQAPMINLQVPTPIRVNRLVQSYGTGDREQVAEALRHLAKRLDGKLFQEAMQALQAGEVAKVAELMLQYYDKTYTFALARKDPFRFQALPLDHGDPELAADQLIAMQHTFFSTS